MMEISLEDFGKCIAVLISGMGKSMTREQVAVYHEMLKDLPLESLKNAVKLALCEHEYATIPSIATLRRLATEEPNSSGWAIACRKVHQAARLAFYEPDRARKILDERTLAAVEAIGGLGRLHDLSGENLGTFTAQFKNAYDALERDEAKIRLRTGIEVQKLDTDEARAIAGLAGRLGVTQ